MSYDISKVAAVIFDLNGTMVHDSAYERQAFELVFAAHHLSVSEATYQYDVASHLNAEIWPRLFDQPLSAEKIERLSEEKEVAYRQLSRGKVKPVEGLEYFINQLVARGTRLAVTTTSPRATAEFVLAELGLDQIIDVVVTGDEVKKGKPDPLIYLLTLGELALRAGDCLNFEDSVVGVQAAVAAGLRSVGVADKTKQAELRSAGATTVVASFSEVYL